MPGLRKTCFHDMPEGNGQSGARAASGTRSALGGGGAAQKEESKAESAGGGPIKSQKQFEQEAEKLIEEYKKDNPTTGEFVPIYHLRRSLGSRVSREEFDDMLLEMQAGGKWQLEKGNVSDASTDQVRDSVTTRISGLRFYIKPAS